MFIRATWRRTGSRGISTIRKRSNAKSARAGDESHKKGRIEEKGVKQAWSEEKRGGAAARCSARAPSRGRHLGRRSHRRSDTNAVAGFPANRAAAGNGPE